MNNSNTFRVGRETFRLAPATAVILRHLKNVGEISGIEAIALYKSRSLTKRISEINDALWVACDSGRSLIEGEWHRDTTGQRYKRYYISKALQANINYGDQRVAA